MQKKNSISILISYDQCMIAEGFQAVLTNHKQFHVYGLRKNKSDLTDFISSNQTDLLIVEIADISKNSIHYINKIHRSLPKLKIIIISGIPPHELLKQLVNITNGYLLRTCSSAKLFLAIKEIFESGKYICSQLIPILFNNDQPSNHNINLTVREKEILSLLFTTKDNSEIAKNLNISQTTVRTHLKNIRNKFGDFNQIQMMRYACNNALHKNDCIPLCPNCKFFCNETE
ncbi:response regulator transcription factor [Labilibaculum sp.]|uniref:response regulator transcription factor n=1 Tax=Labilibaculum sp. TaxID=2060723 RepID=UPI002AA8EAE1|nr:response regulator transcription factor [Labilibaculum sp.]